MWNNKIEGKKMKINSVEISSVNSVTKMPRKIIKEASTATKEPLARRIQSGVIEAGKEVGETAIGLAMLIGIAALAFPIAGPLIALHDIDKDKAIAKEMLSSDEFQKASADIEKISNDPFFMNKLTAWENLAHSLKNIKK